MEPQQTEDGNIIAFFNKEKDRDDKRPLFNGEITLPNDPAKRRFSLWSTVSKKTQQSILSGRASLSPAEQIAAYTQQPQSIPDDRQEGEGDDLQHQEGDELEPREKDDDIDQKPEEPGQTQTPGLAADKQLNGLEIKANEIVLFTNTQLDAENPNRPSYWGYFNPGEGKQLMRLSVWSRTDRMGYAMLSGNVVPFDRALAKDRSNDQAEGNKQEQAKTKKRDMDR